MNDYEVYLQLVLAVFLGSLIGLERRLSRKIAGIRTFALVTLGSTIFSIISRYVATDPSRIAAQVVVGIGFLGAGMIILDRQSGEERVRGLTTAAGLWVASAIGVAIGFSFYDIAIAATVLSIVIFTVLWRFEERFLPVSADRDKS